MREPLSIRATTYALLALFVFMVAVPLFWMVTTALKTNKDLYEDFSYFRARPTFQHFVRVIAARRSPDQHPEQPGRWRRRRPWSRWW